MTDRDKMIQRLLNSYEEDVSGMDDEILFDEDELDELRDQRIEVIIENIIEDLNSQSNEELFGDDDWSDIKESKIECLVEQRCEQLDDASDEELEEMVAVVNAIDETDDAMVLEKPPEGEVGPVNMPARIPGFGPDEGGV